MSDQTPHSGVNITNAASSPALAAVPPSSSSTDTANASPSTTVHPPPHAKAASSNEGEKKSAVDMNHMVVFCADKAGMNTSTGLHSKEHINQVIYEMSVGSAHFKSVEAKNAKVSERIQRIKQTIAHTLKMRDTNFVQSALNRMERKIAELELGRPLSRNFIHVDMDSFYASVEIRDRPELKDLPVAVGGKAMISTSNYVARAFGVRSAMPGFIALKLCPNLVFVPHNFEKYTAVAEQTRQIFREYDPEFEAGSLDEAYLDVTDYVRRKQRQIKRENNPAIKQAAINRARDNAKMYYANRNKKPKLDPHPAASSSSSSAASSSTEAQEDYSPETLLDHEIFDPLPADDTLTAAEIDSNAQMASDIAADIRRRITERTQLTASAGIGCNRMIAKIATDINKPDGQHLILSRGDAIRSFMDSLSVRKIPGVGKVMERILNEIGVKTCEQLRQPDVGMILREVFSQDTANWLISVSLGLASNMHHTEEESKRKSISTERTFREISSYQGLKNKLIELATSLEQDIFHQSQRHSKSEAGNTGFIPPASHLSGNVLDSIGADGEISAASAPASTPSIASMNPANFIGGKTFTLKLKTTEFELLTRSQTLDRFIHTKEDFIKVGLILLKEELDRQLAIKAKQFNKNNASTNPPTAASPHKASSTSPVSTSHPNAATSAANAHPLDGVIKLRLMGVRLSALRDDPEEAASHAAAAGNKSILSFVKKEAAPVHVKKEPVEPSASAASSSFPRVTATPPTDADITSFFTARSDASTQPELYSTQLFSAPTRQKPLTIDRFLKKSLESSFSSSTQSNSGRFGNAIQSSTQPTESRDNVIVLDEDEIEAVAAAEEAADANEESQDWYQELMSQPDPEDIDNAFNIHADDESMNPSSEPAAASSSIAYSSAMSMPIAVTPSIADASYLAPPPMPTMSPTVPAAALTPPAHATGSKDLVCPVCNKNLGNEVGNLELNRHIDQCLFGKPLSSSSSSAPSSLAQQKKRKATEPVAGLRTLEDLLKKNGSKPSVPPAAAKGGSKPNNSADNPMLLE